MTDADIELDGGNWRVVVRPTVGRRIARFERRDGTPVFHPAADGVDGGWFPLVPFGNRVRDRRFAFGGCQHRFAPNLPDGRAVHGFGWQARWTVTDRTAATLTMTHTHYGGGWPWHYDAAQSIAVDGSGYGSRCA